METTNPTGNETIEKLLLKLSMSTEEMKHTLNEMAIALSVIQSELHRFNDDGR